MLEDHCSMVMSNSAYEIKENILKAHMHNKKYVPTLLKSEDLQYALYDKNKNLISIYSFKATIEKGFSSISK